MGGGKVINQVDWRSGLISLLGPNRLLAPFGFVIDSERRCTRLGSRRCTRLFSEMRRCSGWGWVQRSVCAEGGEAECVPQSQVLREKRLNGRRPEVWGARTEERKERQVEMWGGCCEKHGDPQSEREREREKPLAVSELQLTGAVCMRSSIRTSDPLPLCVCVCVFLLSSNTQ